MMGALKAVMAAATVGMLLYSDCYRLAAAAAMYFLILKLGEAQHDR